VSLVSPTHDDVVGQLVSRYGVSPDIADWAARVSQGHIGRARALAINEDVRERRRAIVDVPFRLNSVAMCFDLAQRIVTNATADADSLAAPLDAQDEADIRMAYGDGAQGKGLGASTRQLKSALKDLEKRAKTRHRRLLNDQYDRILLDLTAVYRDVLVVQAESNVPLINEELRSQITDLAEQDSQSHTLRRVDAINEARDQLFANVAAQLVFESLLVTLFNSELALLGAR
jgi:DNA polymerase-3 subunit delta'